jgi:hypothetical protein
VAGNRLSTNTYTLSSNDQETDWFCASALALIALVPHHQTLPEKLHHRLKEGRRERKKEKKNYNDANDNDYLPM